MSTAVDSADAESPQDQSAGPRSSYRDRSGRADVSVLEDRMPQALKVTRAVAGLTCALGLLYLVLSYSRIWHTDIWGHLAYGRWIAVHRQLPTTEPLMPLAAGVPVVDTAWLSQTLGYVMWSRFGISALQFLYAFSITAVAALLAAMVYRRTGNAWCALLAAAVFYVVDYQQLVIMRPQLAGMICFTAVFGMATSYVWRRWYWWGLPAVFTVWANLHGSFLVGLVLLGAVGAGRGIDLFRRTGSAGMVWRCRDVRRLLLVTELAAAMVLLNPYGIGIYTGALAIAGNPNVKDLIEWMPLTLRMSQGQAMAAAAALLIALYRFTPRRVRAEEWLLLFGLGMAALWTSRMIVWWAPVAGYYAGLHGAAIGSKHRGFTRESAERKGLWTVVALGVAWISFGYTPFGLKLIHGSPRTETEIAAQLRKSVSARTPVAATEYLVEHPPQGQVFNTYEWGDYLLWAGPSNLQVFVASHAHLVPGEVWADYLQVSRAAGNWHDLLDRYGVNAIVVDRGSQAMLVRELRRNPQWQARFEDANCIIFFRKKPI